MKICPNCGERYEDGFAFCSSCGTKLTPAPEAPPQPQPAEPDTPAVPQPEPGFVFEEPEGSTVSLPRTEAGEQPPLPPEEPLPPKKSSNRTERVKPAVGIGRRILAALLCLLLFVFLMIPAVGYYLRRSTTREGLTALLQDLRPASMQARLFFTDVEDEELTLSEVLCEDLAKYGLEYGESSVAKVLNSSALKSYLAEQIASVCADIYKGRTRYEWDPETLRDALLEGDLSRVLEKERISFTRAKADTVIQLLEDYGVAESLSRDALKDELPALVRGMNIGLSYILIIALLVLDLGLMLLIFRTNRWQAGLSFGDIGGTAIAVGAVLTLAALFAQLFPSLWETLLFGQTLVAQACEAVLFHNLLISLIILGSGILLAVLGRLLRGKKSKPEEEILS